MQAEQKARPWKKVKKHKRRESGREQKGQAEIRGQLQAPEDRVAALSLLPTNQSQTSCSTDNGKLSSEL